MKSPSNVWIVTSGRTGSTAMFGVIRRIGADTDRNNVGNVHSEHPILVDINTRLIQKMYSEIGHDNHDPESWFVVPPPKGWEEWMANQDLGEFALEIRDKEAMLPHVLKDPRWSLTLGFWYRFAVTMPQHILYLNRDAEQVASSWALVRPELLGAGTDSVKQKQKYLDYWIDKYKYRGVNIHTLNYPHFFYTDSGQKELIDLLSDIFDTKPIKIAKAMKMIVDKSRIHKYNLKDENNDVISNYDPNDKHDYLAVHRKGAHLPEEVEEMLGRVGQLRCPGIKPMLYGKPNTEFDSEIIEE